MSEQQTKQLRAGLLPDEVNNRRPPRQALGRGLGALLLRGELASAASRRERLTVPAWAEGWERPHQRWLKQVWQRSQPRLPQKGPET